jgi:hypothetical protein
MSEDGEQPRRSRARRATRLFEIGKYWLGHEPGRATIYCYHYDAGTRKTRRESTELRDLEDAKVWLATRVLKEAPDKPHTDHALVAIASIRAFYFEHTRINERQNAPGRAFDLILEFLRGQKIPGTPKVADFGLAQQESFMRWCAATKELSARSISTYLRFYGAAVRFCAKPRLIHDRGNMREARVLDAAPFVQSDEASVARVTGLPRGKPRDFVPSEAELARVIDQIQQPHIRRYVILALNTWARPEAIMDLRVGRQVDWDRNLIHMNQEGRQQSQKVRPTIRLTENLRGWLTYWNVDAPICHWTRDNRCIIYREISNHSLKAAAIRAGVPNPERYNKYVFRHFMATKCRAVAGVEVSREQRAEWLGHLDPRHRTTQGWYETLDADFLLEPALATDAILAQLNALCKTGLVAPTGGVSNRFRIVENDKRQNR